LITIRKYENRLDILYKEPKASRNKALSIALLELKDVTVREVPVDEASDGTEIFAMVGGAFERGDMACLNSSLEYLAELARRSSPCFLEEVGGQSIIEVLVQCLEVPLLTQQLIRIFRSLTAHSDEICERLVALNFCQKVTPFLTDEFMRHYIVETLTHIADGTAAGRLQILSVFGLDTLFQLSRLDTATVRLLSVLPRDPLPSKSVQKLFVYFVGSLPNCPDETVFILWGIHRLLQQSTGLETLIHEADLISSIKMSLKSASVQIKTVSCHLLLDMLKILPETGLMFEYECLKSSISSEDAGLQHISALCVKALMKIRLSSMDFESLIGILETVGFFIKCELGYALASLLIDCKWRICSDRLINRVVCILKDFLMTQDVVLATKIVKCFCENPRSINGDIMEELMKLSEVFQDGGYDHSLYILRQKVEELIVG
jgi:hypothetical protein